MSKIQRMVALVYALALPACGGSSTTGPDDPPAASTGVLTVSLARTGTGGDADGVLVEVADARGTVHASGTISVPGEHTFTGVASGSVQVRVRGLGSHCEGDTIRSVSISPSGAATSFAAYCIGQFAYVEHRGTSWALWYLDAEGGSRLLREGGFNSPGMWSPEGDRLLVSRREGDACTMEVVGIDGSVRPLESANPTVLRQARWSPDGRTLVAVGGGTWGTCAGATSRSSLVFFDAATLQETHAAEQTPPGQPWHPDWLADGRGVVFANGPFLRAYSLDDDSTRLLHTFDHAQAEYILRSPAGPQFLLEITGQPSALSVFDPGSGSLEALVSDTISPQRAAWSPDGRSVAYQQSGHIYVQSLTGGSPLQVTNAPNASTGPVWTADGGRLLFADGAGALWAADPAAGRAHVILSDGRRLLHPSSPKGGNGVSW